MPDMLTPNEVADFLRVEPYVVQQWLTSGQLVGFDFGGEWRVSSDQLAAFLRETQERTALAAMKRTLEDPCSWPRHLDTQPELQAGLLAGDYPPDSMGAFLQHAILRNTDAKDTGNIIDINNPKPPGETFK